jgi:RNA polymerase sigma-70 factor (ECF subfamily)
VGTSTVAPAFDETELVAKAKAGDPTAFTELVSHYDRRVFRMAKQITQNDEDAEDVLQETFLKAYSHLDNFQGNSKFYTWLVRIAVNEALMKLRKRRSDKTVPLDDPIDTGEDVVAI